MKFSMSSAASPQSSQGKRYTFTFSRTGLIGFGAVTLLGLSWVFIFGLALGRGYRPEAAVPELARIVPSEQNRSGMLAERTVLPSEELEFFDTLKKDGNRPPSLPSGLTPPADSQPNVVTKPISPRTPPAGTAEDENPTPQAAPAQAPAAPPVSTQPLQQPADSAAGSPDGEPAAHSFAEDGSSDPGQATTASLERFAYVYQAAAFSEPDKATRFQQQVQALDLKARVQKVEDNGKTWHRVIVHFEGTPEDTRTLKEKLKQVGVDKALLRSKKPL